MRSQTQRDLTPGDVADMIGDRLGPGARVAGAQEIGGGGFAAVWRVTLDDGRAVVLKATPPPKAALLSYENGLLAAEAAYFERTARDAPDLPVPRVLHYEDGADAGDGDEGWMVMTLLPGTPLSALGRTLPADDEQSVRRALGRTLARLHTLTGPHFGYTGPGRRRGASWRAVYLGIIDDLLADADRLGSELPLPAAEIRRIIGAAAPVLGEVRQPVMVHFDLWDGNVLVTTADDGGDGNDNGGDGGGRARLTGLVDAERWLYADPLVDFVSTDLFGALEHAPGHPFVRGYAEAGGPATGPGFDGGTGFDRSRATRIKLYRAWLYLVMAVEVPTRAFDGDDHAEARRDRVRRLAEALADLPGAPDPPDPDQPGLAEPGDHGDVAG